MSEKNLPEDKKSIIIRTLKNTVTSANINKVIDGETPLKKIFAKIFDDLGIYYKVGLTTDFTGKLFNEMYKWLGYAENKNFANDVVLTPPYVAKLLVKLCKTNQNSYVWDYATGSAGLLVAAMNEMIIDARKNFKSPDELRKKNKFYSCESNSWNRNFAEHLYFGSFKYDFDEQHKISGGCLAVGMIGMQFFYMEKDFYAGQFTKRAVPKNFSSKTCSRF